MPLARGRPSGRTRQHDDPAIGLFADRLGRDVRVFSQGEVHPAALEGRHRLQLEHLAGLDHAAGCPIGDLPKLALAPAAVVLNIDEHAGPAADLLREHEVDEVLEGRKPFALTADERPEGLPLVALAGHVEPARFRRLDGHSDVEAHEVEELLEDDLARGERLRRRLGGLELGPLGGHRAPGRGHLGGLVVGQVGATGRDAIRSRAFKPRAIVPARGAIAAVVAAQAAIAVAAEAWPVFTRPIIARPVFTRPIIAWPIIAWPVFSGSIVPARGPVPAVVAAWAAIPVAITNARPVLAILAGRWRRQRSGRGPPRRSCR